MTDLNQVGIIGRCVKQPDLVKKGPSGVSIVTFTLAVNRDFFKKDSEEWAEEVSFIDFTLFGKTAENLHKHLTKGKLITVSGYLKQERWQDKDGKTLSRLKVVPVEVNPFVERIPKDNEEKKSEYIEAETNYSETNIQQDAYPDVF